MSKLLVVEVPDYADFRGRPSLGIVVRGELLSAEELGLAAITWLISETSFEREVGDEKQLGQAIREAITKGRG